VVARRAPGWRDARTAARELRAAVVFTIGGHLRFPLQQGGESCEVKAWACSLP